MPAVRSVCGHLTQIGKDVRVIAQATKKRTGRGDVPHPVHGARSVV
jgi:hypothetical protein